MSHYEIFKIIQFLDFIERFSGKHFDHNWIALEQVINKVDRKDMTTKQLAWIALKYSQRNIGSKDLWVTLNKRYMEVQQLIAPIDFAQLILGMSKANVLDKGKFIDVCLEQFTRLSFKQEVGHLDLCQILTTAKIQNVSSKDSEKSQEFWKEMGRLLLQTLKNEDRDVSRYSYALIVNAIKTNLPRQSMNSSFILYVGVRTKSCGNGQM